MIRSKLPVLLLLALLPACSTIRAWDGTQATLRRQQAYQETAPDQLYASGMQELRAGRHQRAVEIFDAIEREHPYSTWATNARLMAAYSDYSRNRYTEAIGALDRFIQLHP
ncbi:MAG TPA: outer membrane protein assembly factor BamD, partial [Acetobacteraceae bacterium]|nr:outer membrane protein assembly factor BamD [Acetobacteraceae bacterium]